MPGHEEGSGSRADGSLGKLTKSFVQLVQQAPNGILDLNNAAAQLDVRVKCKPHAFPLVTRICRDLETHAWCWDMLNITFLLCVLLIAKP